MKIAAIFKPFRLHPARGLAVQASVAAAAPEPRVGGRRQAAIETAEPEEHENAAPITGVSRWLFPQVVLVDCDVRDKREVIDLAASTLERFHGVAAAPVARALWRREAAVATALGHGVAVPHARIEGISEPVTLLIRTARPIPFAAPDRKPVSQFFVILVPADGDPDEHLRLLANVAQLFSQPDFRERIAAAGDTRAARRVFEEYGGAIADDAAPHA